MEIYDIEAYRGDTWIGMNCEVTRNGSPLDLTGAVIRWQIRKNRAASPILAVSSDDAAPLIAITEPLNGRFMIYPLIIDANQGAYWHDLEITLADGTVKTIIKGTVTILDDVTH